MKYLKIFEQFNYIKKYDYVILDTTKMNLMNSTPREKQKFDEFIANNIGVVTNVNKLHNSIEVKFYNISLFINQFFNYDGTLMSHRKYIKLYDSDLENLKIKLEGENYNL